MLKTFASFFARRQSTHTSIEKKLLPNCFLIICKNLSTIESVSFLKGWTFYPQPQIKYS